MAAGDATARVIGEAVRLAQAGRTADAARLLQSGRDGVLRHPGAQAVLGQLLFQSGDVTGALAAFDAAVRIAPTFADGHCNRGVTLQRMGRLADALFAYDAAIRHAPQHAVAHFNRGNVLKLLGRPVDALAAFDAALGAAPGTADIHLNRGRLRLEQRDYSGALADFDAVLAGAPRSIDAPVGAATALHHLRRNEEALARADAALALDPSRVDAALVRGRVLAALGRDAEALAQFDALVARPEAGAKPLAFRASVLRELERHDEAMAAADAAVAADPSDPQLHEVRAALLLARGDYAQGFSEQDWRLKLGTHPRALPSVPLWQGEPLAGKRIVVAGEQGIGDTVQFLRYVDRLVEAGAEVVGLVQRPILPLAQSHRAPLTWVSSVSAVGPVDYEAAMLSLPHRFGTTRDSVPADVPYLFAEPAKVSAWRDRITRNGFRVGINWQGNPNFGNDRRRSVPLARFAPLAAVPGARLVSLQAINGLDQLAALGGAFAVEQPGPLVTDNPDGLSEIAALISTLDLVVTSDTAVAHVAGALGAPVWVATARVPDWRWGEAGDTVPWYPTMRLFRQPSQGDWDSVFAAMAVALRDRIAAG